MKDEKMKILRMLAEGKLTAVQADELLSLLEIKDQPAPRRARWFRVRVMERDGRRVRTNVRLPAEVVEAVLRLKEQLAPDADAEETQKLIDLLRGGPSGQTLEYDDPKSGKVEISVE